MGNKPTTRRRTYSDTGQDLGQKPRRKPKRSQSANFTSSQDRSVPPGDIGGAVPYAPPEDLDINVKVYHSYGDLARPKSTGLDQTDLKIYRKSADVSQKNYASLPYRNKGDRMQKYASLPRHFGRDPPTRTKSDYPEMMSGRRDHNEEYIPKVMRQDSDRTSKRVSSGSSLSLSRAPVSIEDFPTTTMIKKKLKSFEEQFCRSLVDKYAGLPETTQLSSLSILMSRDPIANSSNITLLDIADGEKVASQTENHIVLIPHVLYSWMIQKSAEGGLERERWLTFARDLVMYVGAEAANDISQMFEYQISLLAGDSAVRVLADYAASRAIEYIKKNSVHLDRNTAIIGVVHGTASHEPTGTTRYLSAIIGNRELKWELQYVFSKPGLRKELSLYQSDLADNDGLYTARHYYSNPECDPQLYGYRGQLLEWNFVNNRYKLNQDDVKMFTENISDPITYPDDCHRMYSPYKLVFGTEVMTRYSELKSTQQTKDSMMKFLVDLTCSTRDDIQPVYRPLIYPERDIDFSNLNLKNVDLIRAQLRGADLSGSNMKNSKLLLADVEGAVVDSVGGRSPLEGNDVSYTTLVGSTLDQASLDSVKGEPVVIMRQKPRKKKKVPTATLR